MGIPQLHGTITEWLDQQRVGFSIPDNSIIVFSCPERNSNRSQTIQVSRHKAVSQPTDAPRLSVPGRQLHYKESIPMRISALSPPAATRCCARPDTLCSRPHSDFNKSDTRATTRGPYGCNRSTDQAGQFLTKNFVEPVGPSGPSKRNAGDDCRV